MSGNSAESIIAKMAEAIKKFEGWMPGSRSFRNNNPGNIRWFGAMPKDGTGSGVLRGAIGRDDTNHLIYSSYGAGWNALLFQLRIAFSGDSSVYYPEMSFYEFFSKYAEGNQESYAQTVAREMGKNPNDSIGSLLT